MNQRESQYDRRIDVFLALSTAAVFILTAWLANLEKALMTAVAFGVLFSVVSIKWSRKYDVRFWIIMGIFAIAHLIVLAEITLPDLRPGLIFSLPFGLLDGFLMWGILNWIEKRFPRTTGPKS